jgi:serine/threonine protein phosphatase PrpC
LSRRRTQAPIEIFGATVRGPGHIADGVPNQDAWGHGRVGPGHVVVVSDGMGSRRDAQDGARAACRAVIDAVRQWRRHPDAPVDVLLGLVHLLWRARVAPKSPEDCACTCLFAVVEPDGSGITAQLGDGLVVLRDGNSVSTLATRPGDEFVNETGALGVTSRISAWTKLRFEKHTRSIVLCTDGVADDLLPDRLGTFVDWLISDVRRAEPMKRRYVLERALREWPTPNHLDDKTIAVVHVPGGCR